MNNPEISIIIPVYNTDQYIVQCIDSILNQSFTDFEIIITDDESSDNTVKIIREYEKQDQRIKFSQNPKNIGQGKTRNNALQNALGEYIFFIDSDDWIQPQTLEKLINKAKKYSADIVFFNYLTFFEEKNSSLKMNPFKTLQNYKNQTFTLNDVPEIFNFSTAPWNKIFKKSLLLENKIQFSESIIYEDVLFCFNCYLTMKSAIILDEPLYVYRQREGMTTGLTNHKRLNFIEVIKQTDTLIHSFHVTPNILSAYFKKIETLIVDHFSLTDKNVKKQFYVKLKFQIENSVISNYPKNWLFLSLQYFYTFRIAAGLIKLKPKTIMFLKQRLLSK